MPRIFISYRRNDSLTITGRIYDRLVGAFGAANVFLDFDDIPLGEDFTQVLEREIATADILLAVVGPAWIMEVDNAGNRRLDDPDDFVRIEIETALRAPQVTVIPVLVQNALMPGEHELPSTLQRFSRLQAAVVRDEPDFRYDIQRLIRVLAENDLRPASRPSARVAQLLGRPWWQGVGVIVAIIALAITVLGLLQLQSQPTGPTPDLTATHAVTQTAQAVAAMPSVTTTEMPTETSAPATDTPTRATTPTPLPDNNIAVAINPQKVDPGGDVVVTTQPGATCLFQPTVGRDFGFETSTGTILFVADYEPGVVVEVTCRIGEQRSEALTFTVAAGESATSTRTFTPTTTAMSSETATSAAADEDQATPERRESTSMTLTAIAQKAENTGESIVQGIATSTPTGVKDIVTLTIFRDADSFTLFVPESAAAVSLAGLELRVNLSASEEIVRRLDVDYAAFLGLPFGNLSSLGAVCFRLVLSGSSEPVPQACQRGTLLISQQLATADLFWRDTSAQIERTVFVYQDDALLGVCGPGDSCEIALPVGA